MKSYSLLSNQIVELKLQHEQERTHLLQTHNAEKDSLVQDHQREIDSLDKHARAAMVQQQTQTQEWRKRNAQVGGLFLSAAFCHYFILLIRIMLKLMAILHCMFYNIIIFFYVLLHSIPLFVIL